MYITQDGLTNFQTPVHCIFNSLLGVWKWGDIITSTSLASCASKGQNPLAQLQNLLALGYQYEFQSLHAPRFSLVLASSFKPVFDHISKHLEPRQKYSAASRIFNSLLSVWKCGQR